MKKIIATASVTATLFWCMAPANAITYPMTESALSTASKEGAAKGQDAVVLDPLYQADGDRATWIGFTPTCQAVTPFFKVEFASAKAKQTYANVSAALLREELTDHIMDVNVDLFSTVLHANRSAVGVIKQGAALIRASKGDTSDEDVVDNPQVGYRTSATFEFDIRKLIVKAPFDVVIANVPVYNDTEKRMDGEVVCHFDGSKFR